MESLRRGNRAWDSMMILHVVRDLNALYAKAPQARREIAQLIEDVGEIISYYMVNDEASMGTIIKNVVLMKR